MKRLIFWPVFLAVVLFLAFKVFVWLAVQERLNDVKRDLALTAALSTGWIESDLNGHITIRDVKLTPFRLRDTLTLERITLEFPSVWSLLGALSQAENALPGQMRIILAGGEMPVRVHPDVREEPALPGPLAKLLFPRPCGSVETVQAAQLLEMGYGFIGFDGQLSWTFDRFDRRLRLDWELTGEHLSRVKLSADLQLHHDLRWPPPAGARPPRVIHLDLDLADLGYEQRLNRLCATKSRMTESQVVDSAVTELGQALESLGIRPGRGWLEASRQWMQGNADVRIVLDPLPDFEYNMVSFMSADSVLDALGLKLEVNGSPVQDLGLVVDNATLKQALAPPAEPDAPKAARTPPKPVGQKPENGPAWVEVDTTDVTAWLDLPARVTLHSGKVLEGRLIRADEWQIELTQQVAGGEVGYPVKKVQIAKLEIYTRPTP